MKLRSKKLQPIAPNLGLFAYPMFEPIVDILDAIKRFRKDRRK